MLQGQDGMDSEAFDVAHCTQPPFTQTKAGLKRLKKGWQGSDCAEGGATTPKPLRSLRSKKLCSAECGAAELSPMLQTPMPWSEVGNEFGPPPLNRRRHLVVVRADFITSRIVHERWFVAVV